MFIAWFNKQENELHFIRQGPSNTENNITLFIQSLLTEIPLESQSYSEEMT